MDPQYLSEGLITPGSHIQMVQSLFIPIEGVTDP